MWFDYILFIYLLFFLQLMNGKHYNRALCVHKIVLELASTGTPSTTSVLRRAREHSGAGTDATRKCGS